MFIAMIQSLYARACKYMYNSFCVLCVRSMEIADRLARLDEEEKDVTAAAKQMFIHRLPVYVFAKDCATQKTARERENERARERQNEREKEREREMENSKRARTKHQCRTRRGL